MIPTPAVRNLIREDKTHQILSAMQTGSASGMQTMDASLASLVRAGEFTQRVAEHTSTSTRRARSTSRSSSASRAPS